MYKDIYSNFFLGELSKLKWMLVIHVVRSVVHYCYMQRILLFLFSDIQHSSLHGSLHSLLLNSGGVYHRGETKAAVPFCFPMT